jgi:thiamine-monophosphate kinase
MTERGASGHVALGPGGEFDIIRMLLDRWGGLAKGIGDDAAIVPLPQSGQVVMSTDTSVENVHFRREWLTHAEIGYRATAAALSDLAAMAAKPEGIFLALTLAETDVPLAGELADGIGECVRSADTVVLGGDVTRGAGLSLTITVIGSADRPLMRSGAAAGDTIYVTGRLGAPLCALRELRERRTPAAAFRDRFAHPVPRLREARWLAERGARAAIDISDGLIADARHLAVASGVALHLRSERVPVFSGATSDDALASGEEYELLVTSPGELDSAAFRREFGLDLTEIGEVQGDEADVVLTAGGRRVAPPAGYDHFTPR